MDPIHYTDAFRLEGGGASPGSAPAGWPWSVTLERVVDGDTLVVTFHRRAVLDLGFRDRVVLELDKEHQPVRLVGAGGRPVDAYELHGEDRALGLKAKAKVTELLEAHRATLLPLRVLTWKPDPADKYGRWLVTVPAQAGLNLTGPDLDADVLPEPGLVVHAGLAELLVGAHLARWRDEWGGAAS